MFKPSSLGSWLQDPVFTFERHWRVLAEEPGLGRGPGDTFQEEAAQTIYDNRGGYVAGRGGTGKSWLLELIKKRFLTAGWTEAQIDVIAFTHVQAANVEGDTVLHHLHAKVKCKRHLIIVDESSQIPLRLWAALACFRFTGSTLVVLGDVDGQLPPIADRHREELWSGIDRSRFMHELCGGLRVELHKFRRGGDQAHFDFTGSIYPRTGIILEQALDRAREKYPVRRPDIDADTTLCVSNRCRIAINARINAHRAPADAILVKADPEDEAQQDMRLWPGLVLQACKTDRKHFRNALRYKVLAVDAEVCSLVRINDNAEQLGDHLTIPTIMVPSVLRLCFAITYDSSQARTLLGNVRLTQTDHTHMTLRRLIVGLGRAPEGSQLEVE